MNAVFASYFSILLRYHFKIDLLDLELVNNDEEFQSFIPQEGMRVLIEQIVSTFSDEDVSMVRVQLINNLIFPELQYEFEKFLTEEQHGTLVRFADTVLKTKLEEYKKKYSANAEKCNEAVKHLQDISEGNLPFDYVSESTVDYPYKKIDFLGMLHESNEKYFAKTITRDQFKKLQDIARERLEIYTQHLEHLRKSRAAENNNTKENEKETASSTTTTTYSDEKKLLESNDEKSALDEQQMQKTMVSKVVPLYYENIVLSYHTFF
jgi:hypothetical protein